MYNTVVDVEGRDSSAPHATLKFGKRASSAAAIPSLPDDVAVDLVKLFKLFADETRLRILYFLMQREELNVRALCGLLKQSQPAVSHHLALLRVAGLIECRRDGKHNFYRILPRKFQEYMEMLFAVSPNRAGRISFESFLLSFTPVEQPE
jgi:ArsR family transcriptional regulator, arsenate/arsenite/antimonite-responsive transcriptional repressor